MTEIRALHPYSFRSGQWAELLTTAADPERGDCYVVRFPDGATDWWVAEDPANTYELRESG